MYEALKWAIQDGLSSKIVLGRGAEENATYIDRSIRA